MDFENEYAQRMPMGRVAQVGALVLVVMIVLFVVFWNPAPPVPTDIATGTVAPGESSGGGYTFANTGPDSGVTAVIESQTPSQAPLPPSVPPSTNVAATPPGGLQAPIPLPVPEGQRDSAPVAAPRTPAGPSKIHEITDEDTLYRLAQRYYGSQSGAALIIKANRLAPPYRLPIGMKLVIPAKDGGPTPIAAPRAPEVVADAAPAGTVIHTVQQGDSLYRISIKYFGNHTGLTRIKEANRLTNDAIHVGQRLVIPGAGAEPAGPAVPAEPAPHG